MFFKNYYNSKQLKKRRHSIQNSNDRFDQQNGYPNKALRHPNIKKDYLVSELIDFTDYDINFKPPLQNFDIGGVNITHQANDILYRLEYGVAEISASIFGGLKFKMATRIKQAAITMDRKGVEVEFMTIRFESLDAMKRFGRRVGAKYNREKR